MELLIDNELKGLIPPLSEEEYHQLEDNIVKDGCRDPLVIWGKTIVDGHNRYDICTRLNLPFKTIDKEFEDKTAVRIWMRKNQMGRRNLTPAWRIELELGNKEDILQRAGRPTNEEKEIMSQSDKIIEPHNTRKEIADKAGVSTGQVGMAEVVRNENPEMWEEAKQGNIGISTAYKKIKKQKEIEKSKVINLNKTHLEDNRPIIYNEDVVSFLNRFEDKSIDFLFTDPPYSTDVNDIRAFVDSWLDLALSKIKSRAYICIGAYPEEILAYLSSLNFCDFHLDSPLVWTYRNTLGQTPKMKYNLNYQMILHLYRDDSRELDTSITKEMFSVHDINAPDGRLGNRFHTWQKPDELADRLIRQSTKPGETIIDPFTCTGTFILSAAKQGLTAFGCDISKDNLDIAVQRGCEYALSA